MITCTVCGAKSQNKLPDCRLDCGMRELREIGRYESIARWLYVAALACTAASLLMEPSDAFPTSVKYMLLIWTSYFLVMNLARKFKLDTKIAIQREVQRALKEPNP